MSKVYERPGASENQHAPALHVLQVEDNQGDILLTREALDEIGIPYTLRVLRDGEQAKTVLQAIAEQREGPAPDLILLDINLPKLNGHELLVFIKEHNQLKHVPVVIFTTSSAQEDIAKAYQNQANCYITKPAEAEAFIEALQKIEQFWNHICQLPGSFPRSRENSSANF